MPRTRDESRTAEAVRLYRDERLTRDEVAARLGVRGSTVSRWLDSEARPRGRRKRTDVTDQEVIEGRDGGLSWAELAAATGMSVTGVRLRYAQATGQGRPDRPRDERSKRMTENSHISTPGYETGTDPEGRKVVLVGDEWVSEDEAAEYARAEAEALGTEERA